MAHSSSRRCVLGTLAAAAMSWASPQAARAAADRYEPDNGKSSAKPITSGQTQSRSIHVAGNVDWVKFTLTRASAVVIDTNGSSGDTEMWLYGPNSSTVLAPSPSYSDDAHGRWAKIEHAATNALAAGTYYLKIQEYGNNGTIASYTLSFRATTAQRTAATPTFNPASPHVFAGSTTVTVSCATKGATIRYTTDGTAPKPTSPVYRSPLTFSSTTTLKACAFSSGMGNSAVATGLYTKGLDSHEPDDIASAAKAITSGETQSRNIHAAGNLDWIVFVLKEASAVTIDTNGPSGDAVMYLYGPDSSTNLAPAPNYSDDAHGLWPKIEHTAANPLAPGTYYLLVREYGNDGTIGSYLLSLVITPTR